MRDTAQDTEDRTRPMDQNNPKQMSRHLWWRVGYFLFAIHLVALVMIFAMSHAPK
ncbi:hypothetical protein AB0D04_30030 [Streptomyces sp. NPDC048483]|uniref:hypothetical protein n=1 Tax=Streptomyces sp. NPDC048483 TaxID=3154927 RepID=UPI0034241B0A